MQRRDFLLGVVASPLAFVSRGQSLPSRGAYSMVMGPSDANHLQITLVHQKSESLRYFIRLENNGVVYPAAQVQTQQRSDSAWAVTHVVFADLPDYAPAAILVENNLGQLKDVRAVRWLDPRVTRPRVVVASCAAGYLYDSEIWQRLNECSPDLVLFLGDNLYADRPNLVTKQPADPAQLWAQYVDARLKYDYYFRPELIPTLATWDDHDFGLDNGDRTYQYNRESQDTFNAFWPQKAGVSKNLDRGPGVSSALQAFGMEFILLDNRSARTGRQERDVVPTQFGEHQQKWLKEKLATNATPLWLASGQQFFGDLSEDSHLEGDFPVDFRWLMQTLSLQKRPVGFLSGDVHFSEIMDIEERWLGFSTVEITSSSLHSITFPGQHHMRKNLRRRTATSRHNFVVLDLEVQSQGVKGLARSIGVNGDIAFSENFIFASR